MSTVAASPRRVPRYKQRFVEEIRASLKDQLGIDNVMEVPKLEDYRKTIDNKLVSRGEGKEIATTMCFVRLLTDLLRDKKIGKHIVPIVPDESRTFGMEALFRQIGIYAHTGQLYGSLACRMRPCRQHLSGGVRRANQDRRPGCQATVRSAPLAHPPCYLCGCRNSRQVVLRELHLTQEVVNPLPLNWIKKECAGCLNPVGKARAIAKRQAVADVVLREGDAGNLRPYVRFVFFYPQQLWQRPKRPNGVGGALQHSLPPPFKQCFTLSHAAPVIEVYSWPQDARRLI